MTPARHGGAANGRERDGTHLSRRKYLRREMAELCSALIRAATEFPRDRKAKIITDVSARLSVPDEGADVRNEWIASTGTSRRRRRVGASKTRNIQSMTNYPRKSASGPSNLTTLIFNVKRGDRSCETDASFIISKSQNIDLSFRRCVMSVNIDKLHSHVFSEC